MWPPGQIRARTRTIRQSQRRLSAEAVERLQRDYLVGIKIDELADKYGINRVTVMGYVGRLGLPRRYPALNHDDVRRAATLYRSGQSLAGVANVFGVAPHTVRSALLNAGVAIRPRNVYRPR